MFYLLWVQVTMYVSGLATSVTVPSSPHYNTHQADIVRMCQMLAAILYKWMQL